MQQIKFKTFTEDSLERLEKVLTISFVLMMGVHTNY